MLDAWQLGVQEADRQQLLGLSSFAATLVLLHAGKASSACAMAAAGKRF
jgi:hypothetical protein